MVKKLMMMFAAVAMACAADAAYVRWSCGNIYEKGTSTLSDRYFTYFFDSSKDARATVIAALASGDTSVIGDAVSSGTADNGSAIGMPSEVEWDGVSAMTVKGYAVIFDAADVASASAFFVTTEYDTAIESMINGINIYADDTATSTNWTPMAVPEPTSGLLVLVGGALLALRRRRV